MFADWNAAELDLSYFDGNLEILTPFYQRTLGVGPRGNRVHGIQVSPDIYPRSRFVGGSYAYTFGWKPDEDSRFSMLFFAGANKALIGGFAPLGVPVPGRSPRRRDAAGRRPDLRRLAALFNVDVFYKLSEQFTIGIENDLFIHPGKAGEYLIFPFLTWEAGKHAFFQVGGGYYRFESIDQATFFCHVNLSTQRPDEPRGRQAPRRRSGQESAPGRSGALGSR